MLIYPININLRDRDVVVVGGGEVACRKCRHLVAAGARVRVIAPRLAPHLADLAAQGRIFHLDREYLPGDLTGAMLAFAATDDRLVNAAVATEARSRNILVDVTDAPETGTFTSPAMLIQGDLLITVSTAGKSPALARRIRDELKGRVGPEHATALTILGALREKLLTAAGSSAYNKRLLNDLVDRDLPVLLREKSREDIDRLLTETFGTGFTLAELGVGEKDPA